MKALVDCLIKGLLIFFVCSAYGYSEFYDRHFNCLEDLEKTERFHYPYSDLSEKLKHNGIEKLTIFSYGSLMDKNSARRTLSKTSLESYRPAVAFGLVRLFDRDVPIKPDSKWGVPQNKQARGMLNVYPTYNPLNLVNGVVYDLLVDDLPNILEREEGYDLIPVIVEDWKNAVTSRKQACYIAFTFSAPRESMYINTSIFPRPKYYELSRDAAKHFGPVFYSLWLNSTFLADRKTSIQVWEAYVLQGKSETQVH